jgi:hypothetical protein
LRGCLFVEGRKRRSTHCGSPFRLALGERWRLALCRAPYGWYEREIDTGSGDFAAVELGNIFAQVPGC